MTAQSLYRNSLKQQLQSYVNFKKQELNDALDIAITKQIVRPEVKQDFQNIGFLHAGWQLADVMQPNFETLIEQAIQNEIALCDKYAPTTFDKLDACMNALIDLYALTSAKQAKHDALAKFVDKICEATCKPPQHANSEHLFDPYSVIVADNRLWCNFFGQHTVEFRFDDNVRWMAKISNRGGNSLKHEYKNAGTGFDFRKEDFVSMSFAYQIIDALLNNGSFEQIVNTWFIETRKIDEARWKLKPVLRAIIGMYSHIIAQKVCNGTLFEVQYDTEAGSSTIQEVMYNNKNKDVEIGQLRHKLQGRRNYDALVDWMMCCEFTTASIDDTWLCWTRNRTQTQTT